jgi:hypothetical protein
MRRSSRLTKAADVLTAMQCGATLQLSHAGGGGDVWSLSDGRHVRSDIAKLVTANTWLRKFFEHGNGIAIVRAYTSSAWFHEYVVPRAETMLFPRGKTKVTRPDGSIGSAPGHSVVLLGMGEVANAALRQSGLGFFVGVNRVVGADGGLPTPQPRRSRANVEPTGDGLFPEMSQSYHSKEWKR